MVTEGWSCSRESLWEFNATAFTYGRIFTAKNDENWVFNMFLWLFLSYIEKILLKTAFFIPIVINKEQKSTCDVETTLGGAISSRLRPILMYPAADK